MLKTSLGFMGFPNYFVYENGQIESLKTGRYLKRFYNQHGAAFVTLTSPEGRRLHKTLVVLVAEAFLDVPPEGWDTVLRRDGTHRNTHYTNLAWRTRPYAIRYHKEIRHDTLHPFKVYVKDPDHPGEPQEFPDLREVAMHYAVCETDLAKNMLHGTPLYFAPGVEVYM